VFQNLTSEH